MEKFGRNYILTVQKNSIGGVGANNVVQDLTITPPLTLEFDINRNTLSSANTSTFRIYNLSKNNQFQIKKNVNNYADVRLIQLFAGYGPNMPLVFAGNINQAWTSREGTNDITQVESYDGGLAYITSELSISFPAQSQRISIAKQIAQTLPAVKLGAIGNAISGNIPRGNTYSGGTIDVLRQMSGNSFFIDNQKSYILSDNEYIEESNTLLIDASAGLLGTPILEQTILHFDMLFEPRLFIGKRIQLTSVTEPWLNGFYKVISLHHHGMISDAVCGEAITSVGLYAPLAQTSLVPVAAA